MCSEFGMLITDVKRERVNFYLNQLTETIRPINPFLFANERTEMKLKIYLSEAWMCSEFGMLITDVERERVKIADEKIFHLFIFGSL